MATGLTKRERLAVDHAIGTRIRDLEKVISTYTKEGPNGLATVIHEWRDQRDALLSARPKIAVIRETQP